MGYYEQSLLSKDGFFRERIAACVSSEPTEIGMHPTTWADQHQWQIAAAPGFADAYSYALETGVEDPGKDPAVIADEQLLAAVQDILNPPVPEPETFDPAAAKRDELVAWLTGQGVTGVDRPTMSTDELRDLARDLLDSP